MKITVIGEKDGERKIIRENEIKTKEQKNSVFFTNVIPKIDAAAWDNVKVQISSTEDIKIETSIKKEEIIEA